MGRLIQTQNTGNVAVNCILRHMLAIPLRTHVDSQEFWQADLLHERSQLRLILAICFDVNKRECPGYTWCTTNLQNHFIPTLACPRKYARRLLHATHDALKRIVTNVGVTAHKVSWKMQMDMNRQYSWLRSINLSKDVPVKQSPHILIYMTDKRKKEKLQEYNRKNWRPWDYLYRFYT